MTDRYVDPLSELGGLLLEVQKPARYVGGEAGSITKKDAVLRTLIAFPDLYEIGMGNQAVKIIYNRMNDMEDISCDFAFAPAPDFEKLLGEKKIPLYGLDTNLSLACLDLLLFTVGYELALNGILTMLDVSGIPLHCEERNSDEYPIIIAGGPAVSNPLPFSPFIDASWIGEAEAGFFDLACELAQMKKRGEGRAALFEKIASHPNMWVRGKEGVKRAVADLSRENSPAVFPVPSMKIVQHHGTVEIMRGCPNGCRFCHAGFWYRPARLKTQEQIEREAEQMITMGGWQEVSLSSLSSGDYTGIGGLVENLNNKYSGRHVSFQLPSLKVSGFSLDLLEKISLTRKSGLTFAVETPVDSWQFSINKEVTRGSVVDILREAKKRGWSKAKFYFMIGLPVPSGEKSEEEEIVSFIADVAGRSRMRFNINVGVFIPKPHTPYQWSSQLDSKTAEEKLAFIRSRLKSMGHKVSVSDTLVSMIEGFLSRGDEKAGLLCEEAWRRGSRLDAWSEYIDKDIWRAIFEENADYLNLIITGEKRPLPWEGIESGVNADFILKEFEKSEKAERTASCFDKCGLCGVCDKEIKITETQKDEKNTHSNAFLTEADAKNNDTNANTKNYVNHKTVRVNENHSVNRTDPDVYKVLFAFSKKESAVFHGHLSLIEIFSMSFRRAGIPVLYSLGFNPLAKIEIACPLTTGISASYELASADFAMPVKTDNFVENLNRSLPSGFRIEGAECFYIKSGMKKHSLASLLWGFRYEGRDEPDYVKASEEKTYRQKCLENGSSIFSLKRKEVLARNVRDKDTEWSSYFDTYRYLYPEK
ncbi:MAG: TIGR03936 family radical SAM-associated protein [Treponema sp.]|jgi:radical SAM-linked protein|nr:TIGR03936 family radical SAM-associated protein [Treponema sp.]